MSDAPISREPGSSQTRQANVSVGPYRVVTDDGDATQLSVLGLAATLLRRRRLIILTATVTAGVLVLGTALFRSFRATSSLAPHDTDRNSQLAGLAAQFGLNIGGVGSGESLDFYASLLGSRSLLARAVETSYTFASDEEGRDTLRGTLLELYGTKGSTPSERLDRGIRRLQGSITVRKDQDAGIIILMVKAKWAGLAEHVNGRLLELLNEFNLTTRQTQAKAERTFVESRLAEARAELSTAEEAVARFLTANRLYENSPRLRADLARLQRRVDLAQQVYVTLAQALEQARLEEVRNTPVVTIIDNPEGTARHSPSLLLTLILGTLLGAVLGAGLAFAGDYVAKERLENPDAYKEFAGMAQAALGELKIPRRKTN